MRGPATGRGFAAQQRQHCCARQPRDSRDLRESGYVTSRREGRRVIYSVVPDKPFRSDLLGHHTVGELLGLLAEVEGSRKRR